MQESLHSSRTSQLAAHQSQVVIHECSDGKLKDTKMSLNWFLTWFDWKDSQFQLHQRVFPLSLVVSYPQPLWPHPRPWICNRAGCHSGSTAYQQELTERNGVIVIRVSSSQTHVTYMMRNEARERSNFGEHAHFVDLGDNGVQHLSFEWPEDNCLVLHRINHKSLPGLDNTTLNVVYRCHRDHESVFARTCALHFWVQLLFHRVHQLRSEIPWMQQNLVF